MSQLKGLLEYYCQANKEYKSVGSLISRAREKGKDYPEISQVYVVSNVLGIVKSEEYHENKVHSEDTSNYTVIRTGMFAYNPSRLNIGSFGLLTNDESGLVSPMYVVFSLDETIVDKNYFLYLMKSSYVKNKIDSLKEEGARFRFDFERWDKILIPIPPIEIQKKIVKILDKFKELSAELIAERIARIKQYEYYRDAFFENCSNIVFRAMGELGSFYGGLSGKSKNDFKDGNANFITYVNVFNNISIDLEDTAKVKIMPCEKQRKLKYMDVIFTGSSETQDECAFSSVVCETPKTDYYLNSFCFVWELYDKSIFDPNYLKHMFRCSKLRSQLRNTASGVTRFNVSKEKMKKVMIPIPSLETQKHIAKVLDGFYTLCSSFTEGLPAEIEARQKQYDYYRDKLLSFN